MMPDTKPKLFPAAGHRSVPIGDAASIIDIRFPKVAENGLEKRLIHSFFLIRLEA